MRSATGMDRRKSLSCIRIKITARLSFVNAHTETSLSDTVMPTLETMDIYDIRREQLQRLIDERFDGTTKRLAEALDMPPPQIHRWRSTTAKDKRRMEWESARNIESKLGLPDGWMDHTSTSGPARRFSEDQMKLATRLRSEEHTSELQS